LTNFGSPRTIALVSQRSTKRIAARLNDHREWLPRSEYIYNRSVGEIRRAAFDPSLHSLRTMADAVRSLGYYCGARGLVKLQDGIDGWADIAGALKAYLWSARLDSKSYYSFLPAMRPQFRSGYLHRLPLTVCLLAYFVAVDEENPAHEVWSLFQNPLFDPDQRTADWWYERHFEPSFAALYARVRTQKIPLDPSRWDLNIYAPILEQWEDDQAVAQALSRACDYHLNHMQNTSHWDAEFDHPPFDLIPVEILAVQRLRGLSGLQTVPIDHPLAGSFCPIVKAQPLDEILSLFSIVEEKYREFTRPRA
jgi:hypothetical protein